MAQPEISVSISDTAPADKLEPPSRPIASPLRFPISNVFRSSSGGTAVSGRVCSGVVQVGERLRILPGDETALVRCKHLAIYLHTILIDGTISSY